MRRYQKIGILLALAILLFSGCSAQSESGADSQGKISEETMRTQRNQEGNTAQLREEPEVRDIGIISRKRKIFRRFWIRCLLIGIMIPAPSCRQRIG